MKAAEANELFYKNRDVITITESLFPIIEVEAKLGKNYITPVYMTEKVFEELSELGYKLYTLPTKEVQVYW